MGDEGSGREGKTRADDDDASRGDGDAEAPSTFSSRTMNENAGPPPSALAGVAIDEKGLRRVNSWFMSGDGYGRRRRWCRRGRLAGGDESWRIRGKSLDRRKHSRNV